MQDFVNHINKTNLQFLCYRFGDRNEKLIDTINFKNELNSGATAKEIAKLKDVTKMESSQLIKFYQKYSGIKLYCNRENFGLEFFSVQNLEKANQEWKYWFFDYEDNELYDFQKYGTAFGKIAHSGKYFILYEGKVFLSDHEGSTDTPIGDNFYSFLSKIANNPLEFFAELGADIKYSDYKKGQLVPKEIKSVNKNYLQYWKTQLHNHLKKNISFAPLNNLKLDEAYY